MWYGEERPRWLGPIPFDYPAYLTGELPGDYGFDAVGLGKDPKAFQKYFKYVFFMCVSPHFHILHACSVLSISLNHKIESIYCSLNNASIVN